MAVDITKALAHLMRREEEIRQRGRERAEKLGRHLAPAAEMLRRKYGATRVVLFGSLAVGEPRPTSDVDIAVEGLEGTRYFDALGELMAMFQAPVDLVRIEEAPESLLQRLAVEGKPL